MRSQTSNDHKQGHETATPMNLLLDRFDAGLDAYSRSIQSLTEQIETYIAPLEFDQKLASSDPGFVTLQTELQELQADWADLLEDDTKLREELNEDKWLTVLWQ
jgi:hypothetical protein